MPKLWFEIIIFYPQKPGLLGEMATPKGEAGEIVKQLKHLTVSVGKYSKNDGDMSKRHRS